MRILKTNYPQNPMVTGQVKQEEKVWWKFWEAI
jgi:outer membrane protein assembly factor BamD